jgi:hypothetical protein
MGIAYEEYKSCNAKNQSDLSLCAAVAVFAIAHLELRPRIQMLRKQRDEFKTSSEQNRARAMKAETSARELSGRLMEVQSQAEAAGRESTRTADENTRLLIDLEESRAMLHSTKQELARWNAVGIPPDQIASLFRDHQSLALQLSQLQANHDRLARDFANAQRLLASVLPLDAVPDLPPMDGSVLVVDPKWNFVVLDIGETKGLVKNGVLTVSREGKLIGKVKVRRVESDRSIADILPGWHLGELREGDRVIN